MKFMLARIVFTCVVCCNSYLVDVSACNCLQRDEPVLFSGANYLNEFRNLTNESKEIKSVIFKNVTLDKKFNSFFQQKIPSKLDLLGFINCDLSNENSFYDILPDGVSLKKLLIINCGLTFEDFRLVLNLLDPYVLESMNVSNNKDIDDNLVSFRHVIDYYENCWSVKNIEPTYSISIR